MCARAEKYKDQGLVVIGVHSPELEFEKNVDNVRPAAEGMRVDYPIAIDSDHAIWRAFKNEYWPALYSSMRRDIFDIIIPDRAGRLLGFDQLVLAQDDVCLLDC